MANATHAHSVSLWTGRTDLSSMPATTRRVRADEKAELALASYPIIGELKRADFRPIPGFQVRATQSPEAVMILGYDPTRRIALVQATRADGTTVDRFVPEFLIGTKRDPHGSVTGDAWKPRATRRTLGLLSTEGVEV